MRTWRKDNLGDQA